MSVIVIFGDEPFLVYHKVKAIKKEYLGRGDIQEYQESEITCASLTSLLDDGVLILGTERLIIVYGAGKLVKKKDNTDRLVDGLNSLHDDTKVVFIVNSKDNKVKKWGSGIRDIKTVSCMKLKDYDNNNEVIKWILAMLSKAGYKIEDQACNLLFRYVGNNLFGLWGEISKLKVLCADGKVITKTDVKQVCRPVKQYKSYDIVQDALLGRLGEAVIKFNFLSVSNDRSAAIGVVASAMSYVEKLIISVSMKNRGSEHGDISSAVGLPVFIFNKSFAPVLSKFSIEYLAKLFKFLFRMDSGLKSSSIPVPASVVLLLVMLAKPSGSYPILDQ